MSAVIASDILREHPSSATDILRERGVLTGDFRQVLAGLEGVDLILTDPPYPREFLPLWSDLAAWAARVLKPNGLLVALSGQYHLQEVQVRLNEHLRYWWLGFLVIGGPAVNVWPRRLRAQGKPVFFYGRKDGEPTRTIPTDVFRSARQEKGGHPWQQNLAAYQDMVRLLSEPGQLIADPFVGHGTTAVACKSLNRRFVGAEVEAVVAEGARQRLGQTNGLCICGASLAGRRLGASYCSRACRDRAYRVRAKRRI